MQYRKGLVTVEYGSAVVTGNSDTKWLGKFSPGALFAIPNEVGTYYIQSVDSDSQLTLTSPWAGLPQEDSKYWVTVDFTPILGLPLAQPNDLDATRVIEKALMMLDSLVNPSVFGVWSVKSAETVNPPVSPNDGDAYIVPNSGATGAWTSYSARLAVYRRGSWLFYQPGNAQLLRAEDNGSYYSYSAEDNAWSLNSAMSSGTELAGREANPTDRRITYWDDEEGIIATADSITVESLISQLADRVTVSAQTLTAPQKTQVRANIGTVIGTDVQAHASRLDLIVSQGIDASMFHTAFLDTDITLTANSNTRIASQSATKSYVDNAVAALVGSSPSALDTLNELAAALGGDANFATTTATALGQRLRFDTTQSLSSGQKVQGRANLGFSIDTDGTMAANSDTALPSQKAVRDYIATQIAAAGLSDHSVTYVKLQNVAASRLVGNPTGAAATMAEISLGAGLAFSGTVLQTQAHTGDVTSAANSLAMTVAKIQGETVSGVTGTGKVVFDTTPTINGAWLTGVAKIDTFSEHCAEAVTATTASTPINISNRAVFDITLGINSTAISFTNCPADSGYLHTFLVYVRQDATGNRTPSWAANIHWPNGTPPASTKTAGHYDIFQFMSKDGGTTYVGGLIYGNLS